MKLRGSARPEREQLLDGRRTWLVLSALMVFVFAAAMLGIALTRDSGRIDSFWLANAGILAAFIRLPRPQWPMIAIAAYAANALARSTSAEPALFVFALPLFDVGEAWLGAFLFGRMAGVDSPLSAGRPLLAFIVGCVLAAPMASVVGAAIFFMVTTGADPIIMIQRWFVADALGVATLAPVLLSLRSADLWDLERGQIFEIVGILALNATVSILVFRLDSYSPLFVVLPCLVLAAFRARFLGTALALLVVSSVAIAYTLNGRGPIAFAFADIESRILVLQFFLATAVFSTLPVAAILAERERLTARLAEGDREHNLLAENTNDIVERIGMDGVVRYVSPAATRLFGYGPEDMIGQDSVGLFHPEDVARVGAAFHAMRAGTPDLVVSFRQRHRDGHYLWLESTCHLVIDPQTGVAEEFIASVRDVSRRHEAERAAKASAEQLAETVRLLNLAEINARLGHWRLDAASRMVQFSDNACRIHGFEVGQPVPASAIIATYHPDDRPRIEAWIERLLIEGLPISERGCLLRGSGETRVIRVEGDAVRAPNGDITGAFGVVQDITEQADAESELRDALAAASEASRAKSDFLATMSHEIRTPMTGVLGMIELLRTDPAREDRDRFFTSLDQSARALLAVVDDLLDFARLEREGMTLEQAPFDLRQLVENAVNLFRGQASARGLTVTLEMSGMGDVWVEGDSIRLQQILSNLISNAIKFTSYGRIDVRVLALLDHGGAARWRFEVIDTGIGIAPETIPTLFTPFVQADASMTRRFGGTGLGLAICRRLVEAMGGAIGVASVPGEGAMFWFEIPLAQSRGSNAITPPSALASAEVGDRLDILLAEDHEVIRLFMTALLERLGHRVTCVANGRAAVEAVADGVFDAVLMDMQMPEMDGIEATRAIRNLAGARGATPVFAVTADAAASRRSQYETLGLTAFLTKPLDVVMLSAALATVRPVGAMAVDAGPGPKAASGRTDSAG